MSQLMRPADQTSAMSVASLGFWVYLMTDCVLFASLFATYAVLHNSTFGGPEAHTLFNQPYALIETLLLLTSSFTCGVSVWASRRQHVKASFILLVITLLLGASFLTMELSEFHSFVAEGNSWQRSGFLSSFFTLVGTHGAHISAGIIWALVLLIKMLRQGLTPSTTQKLMLFSLFWHFLDVIWILIFTIVYLMGALQ